MPTGLHRTYGVHHLHFITCSCYHRLPFLNLARARDRLLSILEQTRQRYRFVVVGYVVMPEHIHLLITEPEVGSPSTVMQGLKQRTAHALLPRRKCRGPRQRELFDREPRRAFVSRFALPRMESKISLLRRHRTRPSQNARRAGHPRFMLAANVGHPATNATPWS